jgi:CIC family chloride channel protein
LSDDDRRTAVAVGIGAGIGAIFRAPLGGAVLASEILYLHDLEVEAIIPSLIASIVGYSIYGMITGFTPVFGNLSQFSYAQPIQLVYYAILGLGCGGVGILYARCFYGTAHLVHQIQIPRALKPAIGGFLVGCLGLVLPEVLGMGYGWIQLAMTPAVLGLPLWAILLIPFVKILATSFSIGSGGSGGIFGPGMVIGGMLGAAFWWLGHAMLPGMPPDSAPFIIIGMMALFGGIAHAPLAVMLMVAEMTGNLSLLAPAMLAVGIAYLVVGNNTIYASQIKSRADSPAHRARYRFPLLSSLTIAQALETGVEALRTDMTVAEAATAIEESLFGGAPVVDVAGNLVGVFTRGDLRRIGEEARSKTTVADTMNRRPITAFSTQTLDVALELLSTKRIRWLVVTEPETRFVVGVLTAADVVRTYRGALDTTVQGVSGLVGGGDVVDVTVQPESAVTSRTLADLRLMPETLVVSIRRDDHILVPTGNTELHPGDILTLLNRGRSQRQLRELFETSGALSSAMTAHGPAGR